MLGLNLDDLSDLWSSIKSPLLCCRHLEVRVSVVIIPVVHTKVSAVEISKKCSEFFKTDVACGRVTVAHGEPSEDKCSMSVFLLMAPLHIHISSGLSTIFHDHR